MTSSWAAIVAAVAAGDLTPCEAAELSSVVAAFVKAIETTELDQRLRMLEDHVQTRGRS